MAVNDEYVVGIRTEVYESEETMQSLKNRIKSLQDEILNLDKDTEKYNKTLEELQKASQKYNETISLTKKNAFALEGSYDALTQKMSLLKKEWRATNDESRRNELGKQIADINTQLKNMDAEIGNYQRNVGNYEGSLQNQFQLLRQEIKKYQSEVLAAEEGTEEWRQAIQKLGDAKHRLQDMNEMAKLATNDIGEQLSALSSVGSGVASAFGAIQGVMTLVGKDTDNLQKQMVKMQAVMAIVQGAQGIDGMIKGLKGLSMTIKTLGTNVKGLTQIMGKNGWLAVVLALAAALFKLNQAIQNGKALAVSYSHEIETLSNSMKAMLEINAMNDAATERQAKLMQAEGKTEAEILQYKLDQKLAEVQTATEKVDEAQAQIDDIDDKLAGKLKKKQRETLLADKADAEALKEQLESIKDDLVNDQKDIEMDLKILGITVDNEAKQKAIDAAKDLAAQIQSVLDEQFNNAYTIDIDALINADLKELMTAGNIDLTGDIDSDKILAAFDKIQQSIQKTKADLANIDYLKGDTTYLNYLKQIDRDETEFAQKRIAKIKELMEAELDPAKYMQLAQELNEVQIQYERESLERQKEMADAEVAIREEAEQKKVEAMTKTFAIMNQSTSLALNFMSSIMTSVADSMEVNEKYAEENAKKIKDMRIAAATIDMLQGVVAATTSAFSPTNAYLTIYGQIAMAALTSGSVIAAGLANINKIKATNELGGSTTTPVIPSATATGENQPTITYSRALTGNSEQNNNNNTGSQQVYILESDILKAMRRVQIRQSESTF